MPIELSPVIYGTVRLTEKDREQLTSLGAGLLLLDRLRQHGLPERLVWRFPPDFLPIATMLYGIPVQHDEATTEPQLAHRIGLQS